MSRAVANALAAISLIALTFECLLWEGVLAPLRPGGSFVVLKALPLLLPLRGVLRGHVYTYQWASLLALLYFCEGVVRAWSEHGPARALALLEVALSLLFVGSALAFIAAARSRDR
ncbi:MAG TPA: DUF2069 domain-containing protein [Burkholderiales bacterium]|nr:DUF2069 domain-containing protein [Burkholderiales bacterium]